MGLAIVPTARFGHIATTRRGTEHVLLATSAEPTLSRRCEVLTQADRHEIGSPPS
jgi:hypothetical protein